METPDAHAAGPVPDLIVLYAAQDAELDFTAGDGFWYHYFEELATDGVLSRASWLAYQLAYEEATRRLLQRADTSCRIPPAHVRDACRQQGDSANLARIRKWIARQRGRRSGYPEGRGNTTRPTS